MKKWMNPKYTSIALYAFLALLAALLFLLLLLNLPAVLSFLSFLIFAPRGVWIGIFIALILFPMCDRFESLLRTRLFRKKPRPRTVRFAAVSLSYIILLICVAIVVVSILPLMNQNYTDLQMSLTDYIDSLVKMIQSNTLIYNFILSQTGLTGENASELLTSLITRYSEIFTDFAGNLLGFLYSTTQLVSDTLIALILAFYFLLARESIAALFRKFATAFFPDRTYRMIARIGTRIYTDIMEFISARLISSFALGVFCYLLSWALGVQFYPILSLLTLVLNIVPVVGPIVAVLVCTLIVFLAQPQATWVFLLIILSLNAIEQFLVERHLLGKRLRLNAALTLILVLISYYYMGLIGTILAVPLYASLRAEFSILLDLCLKKRALPLHLGSYGGPGFPEPHPESAASNSATQDRNVPEPPSGPDRTQDNDTADISGASDGGDASACEKNKGEAVSGNAAGKKEEA